MRLSFQQLFNQTTGAPERFLKERYYWATYSRLEPMIKVAKTIQEHQAGELRWFQSRANNGILKGINSLIQAAKAKAHGNRTVRNLITMAYLIAERLSYAMMVDLIGATSTSKGLKAKCTLDRGSYPAGIKVEDHEMAKLHLDRAEFHGDWNYTLKPRNQHSASSS